ncbi:DUF4255 domain-containing protein [Caballeronia sp. SEWSISQ10-4 2]|uniref:DUF4255 domain-containing protein n=1 Tax=Caballeronia sp. SEWSISQ10-4 2 TaxID=2937438 RepID=UPI00265242C9|nr:DUF4255 domain-containing protein [Caballeronia sp. SEWSISQ10-4 2]MDN7179622.1 DUF4255 domain-containing protein [Caballeronia sp. SEWSISQ10-4 2]
MSGANAIAAVTATLRNLLTRAVTLEPELQDTFVTTMPMDRARDGNNNANQLNVFLYQAMPSAAWRNLPMPGQSGQLETAMPPLALNLYYLITAYGRDNDAQSPFSHFLLGRAMSVLHDHPLLGAEEIRLALPDNDLYLQIERVRFTLQPLSVEDIFRLWSGFQTQYRLSASYEAAVVLIESSRATRAPLPVLTRGKSDSGVAVQGNLVPPFPAIEKMTLPDNQPAAKAGDLVTISGAFLGGDTVNVVFTRPPPPGQSTPPEQIIVAAEAGSTGNEVKVHIDAGQGPWKAGWYVVTVAVTVPAGAPSAKPGTTNELWLAYAPDFVGAMPLKATIANGAATIKLKCVPEVTPTQRVLLLLGDRELHAAPRTAQTAALSFPVDQAVPGEYPIRLRVDGVDSLLVDRSVSPPVYRNHKMVLK